MNENICPTVIAQNLDKRECFYLYVFGNPIVSAYKFEKKACKKQKEFLKFLLEKFELISFKDDNFLLESKTFKDTANRLLIFYSDWNFEILFDAGSKISVDTATGLKDSLIKQRFLVDENPTKSDSKVCILVKGEYGLSLRETKIKKVNLDINLNYNDSLVGKHNSITEFLKSDKQGLLLFRGEAGCGKTFYVRYLVSKLCKDVNFVYIPNNLLGELSGPEFLSFLTSEKKENQIFIIEDAENVLKSREVSDFSSNSVANLLNISDGILGDILQLKFILTFNAPIHSIDTALLRKGRLFLDYEFDRLELNKTNNLLKSLDKNFVSNESMTLANIFNYGTENKKEKEHRKIGFAN